MNDLQELYKEMSRLVIEQGTVMDRIDQNVFEARFQVSLGKDKIEDTLKSDTSQRAKCCIIFLVQAIMICCVFLVLKHTWVGRVGFGGDEEVIKDVLNDNQENIYKDYSKTKQFIANTKSLLPQKSKESIIDIKIIS